MVGMTRGASAGRTSRAGSGGEQEWSRDFGTDKGLAFWGSNGGYIACVVPSEAAR